MGSRAAGWVVASPLVLVALAVAAVAFGAAFAIGELTQDESSGGAVPQATPIEPSPAAPKLPLAPAAPALPELITEG